MQILLSKKASGFGLWTATIGEKTLLNTEGIYFGIVVKKEEVLQEFCASNTFLDGFRIMMC